jgi:hypothetical protein
MNLSRRPIKKHKKLVKHMEMTLRRNWLQEQLVNTETAIEQEIMFIHPDYVPLLCKLLQITEDGFAYIAGVVKSDGNIEYYQVTSAWVAIDLTEAYVKEAYSYPRLKMLVQERVLMRFQMVL